jgi:hypothetical protein
VLKWRSFIFIANRGNKKRRVGGNGSYSYVVFGQKDPGKKGSVRLWKKTMSMLLTFLFICPDYFGPC